MRAHRPSQKMAQASAPYRPTPAARPPSALESRRRFRPSLSSSHARDGPSGRGPARRCFARAGLAPRAARGGVRQGTVRARANERRGPAQRAGHARQAHPAGHGGRASRRGTPPRSAAASGSAPAPAPAPSSLAAAHGLPLHTTHAAHCLTRTGAGEDHEKIRTRELACPSPHQDRPRRLARGGCPQMEPL